MLKRVIYIWLVFKKDAEVIQWKKKEQSLKEQCLFKKKIQPYLTPYTKFNKKWIICLKVNPKTIKLLEKNRENLCVFVLDKDSSTGHKKPKT